MEKKLVEMIRCRYFCKFHLWWNCSFFFRKRLESPPVHFRLLGYDLRLNFRSPTKILFFGKITIDFSVHSFSLMEMFWSANQNKQLPNNGANLESHDARLMTVNTRVKSGQAYAMIQILILKEVMNPFTTRWDEPFAGKEKRVVNICLHELNSDRAVRSIRPVHAELFHSRLVSQEGPDSV